jgi:hypothetical protein
MRHAIGQTSVEVRATLKPMKLRGWHRLSPGAKLMFDPGHPVKHGNANSFHRNR